MSVVKKLQEMVCHDLDPDFVETAAIAMVWEYERLFLRLAEVPGVSDAVREEEFARQRGGCAVNALVAAATKHGVPFEFHRLACNGQSKLLVRAGRVIIIQEPILTLSDRPRATHYKRSLSDTQGSIRQLELDLGDRPNRIPDWSGCVLAVLLHGDTGPRFERRHKTLGGLFLAVPDDAYGQWVLRLDLHDVAMFGRRPASLPIAAVAEPDAMPEQRDEVIVTSKRRRGRGTA